MVARVILERFRKSDFKIFFNHGEENKCICVCFIKGGIANQEGCFPRRGEFPPEGGELK